VNEYHLNDIEPIRGGILSALCAARASIGIRGAGQEREQESGGEQGETLRPDEAVLDWISGMAEIYIARLK
jgi:hypothetical protein